MKNNYILKIKGKHKLDAKDILLTIIVFSYFIILFILAISLAISTIFGLTGIFVLIILFLVIIGVIDYLIYKKM
jgi:hypothetical protein